jgi:hypothetical protein
MMRSPLVLGAVLLVCVWGGFTLAGELTAHEPVERVLAIDTSLSFQDEVESCPGALVGEVRRAIADLDEVKIASFDRIALGRPWAHERDYGALHDGVEVADRDAWAVKERRAARAALDETAAQPPPKRGSVALELLERIAAEYDQSGAPGGLEIAICSDGEIVDEKVDVRRPFDQDRAVRTWAPRLRPGLEGARVTITGFGIGMTAEQTRRSRQFVTRLLGEVGVEEVRLDAGVG